MHSRELSLPRDLPRIDMAPASPTPCPVPQCRLWARLLWALLDVRPCKASGVGALKSEVPQHLQSLLRPAPTGQLLPGPSDNIHDEQRTQAAPVPWPALSQEVRQGRAKPWSAHSVPTRPSRARPSGTWKLHPWEKAASSRGRPRRGNVGRGLSDRAFVTPWREGRWRAGEVQRPDMPGTRSSWPAAGRATTTGAWGLRGYRTSQGQPCGQRLGPLPHHRDRQALGGHIWAMLTGGLHRSMWGGALELSPSGGRWAGKGGLGFTEWGSWG